VRQVKDLQAVILVSAVNKGLAEKIAMAEPNLVPQEADSQQFKVENKRR